jgi:glucose-1-phosphate cytidylyltransferase
LSSKIFKYLKNDKSIFEQDCLPVLSKNKQLLAFKHNGFWACMDTLREKKELNALWKQKKCAWKIW